MPAGPITTRPAIASGSRSARLTIVWAPIECPARSGPSLHPAGRLDHPGQVVGEGVVVVGADRARIAVAVGARVVADDVVAGSRQGPRAVDDQVAMRGDAVGEDDQRSLALALGGELDAPGALDRERLADRAQAAARASLSASRRSPTSS